MGPTIQHKQCTKIQQEKKTIGGHNKQHFGIFTADYQG
jgi:hypothetical protein